MIFFLHFYIPFQNIAWAASAKCDVFNETITYGEYRMSLFVYTSFKPFKSVPFRDALLMRCFALQTIWWLFDVIIEHRIFQRLNIEFEAFEAILSSKHHKAPQEHKSNIL